MGSLPHRLKDDLERMKRWWHQRYSPLISSWLSHLGVGLGAMIMRMVLSATNYRTMFLCLSFIGLINLSYFTLFVREKSAIRRD